MPPPTISTLTFKFDNFTSYGIHHHRILSDLKSDIDGNVWRVAMYPNGETSTRRDVGIVQLCLYNKSEVDLVAAVSFIVRACDGRVYYEKPMAPGLLRARGKSGRGGNIIDRQKIIDRKHDILIGEHESLVVEVVIQVCDDVEMFEYVSNGGHYFTPGNPCGRNLLKLLDDANNKEYDDYDENEEGKESSSSGSDADVQFQLLQRNNSNNRVGGKQEEEQQEKDEEEHEEEEQQEEIIRFYAHKLILKMNAPELYHLCEDADEHIPIPIHGISPEVFRIVLNYAYGGQFPKREPIKASSPEKEPILKLGLDIIDAADRYGLIDV